MGSSRVQEKGGQYRPSMSSKAPDAPALADALRALTASYANANQGSDEHPLGHAEVGSFADILPTKFTPPPSVLAGFAVRFKDGTTYLVNVHQIPGSVPK